MTPSMTHGIQIVLHTTGQSGSNHELLSQIANRPTPYTGPIVVPQDCSTTLLEPSVYTYATKQSVYHTGPLNKIVDRPTPYAGPFIVPQDRRTTPAEPTDYTYATKQSV